LSIRDFGERFWSLDCQRFWGRPGSVYAARIGKEQPMPETAHAL